MHPQLIETLRQAQRFGFFGDRDVVEAAAHARSFVDGLGVLPSGARVVDLGSGGGLPGLVLADALPHVAIYLIDRRQKRTDFLSRAVRRLGWEHVTVLAADARELIDRVERGETQRFDAVTARGFGPPELTLRTAAALCRPGGRIVISEPPSGDRWPEELLIELDATSARIGPVRRFDLAASAEPSGPAL